MRILVVDDTDAIRESLRKALQLEGYEVDVASGGREALEMIGARPPTAIVLDRLMPDVDGIEVCRRLRGAGDTTPVLMLTVRADLSDRVSGLDAGADDYLTKPFALEELTARLRALVRRVEPAGGLGETLSYADLTVDTATREVSRGLRMIELTATEYDLLVYLLSHPRRVLTRDQILEHVWGYPSETSSNTLEVYVGYLRRKLEADGEPRLIHTVRGVGYALRRS